MNWLIDELYLRTTLYKSLVLPHLDYCDLMYELIDWWTLFENSNMYINGMGGRLNVRHFTHPWEEKIYTTVGTMTMRDDKMNMDDDTYNL